MEELYQQMMKLSLMERINVAFILIVSQMYQILLIAIPQQHSLYNQNIIQTTYVVLPRHIPVLVTISLIFISIRVFQISKQ